MTRLASLPRATLDDEQRALFDEIAGGDRARRFPPGDLVDEEGGLQGPFNALLLVPAIGRALQEVGTRLRTQGRLAGRLREIAILTTAAHYRAQYEWYAHAPMAREAGLGDGGNCSPPCGELTRGA
jgi:4-carboxymuconolactone decarboxylase